MRYPTLALMALALSMDAMAVAVARGMVAGHRRRLDALTTALAFGAAQAVMPVIGFWGGRRLAGEALRGGGSLLAALVLAALGVKMLLEAGGTQAQPSRSGGGYAGGLAAQATATSIDALAVGIGLCGMGGGILLPAVAIGGVTAAVCWLGFWLGAGVGGRDCRRAQLLGGAILLLLALRTLLG